MRYGFDFPLTTSVRSIILPVILSDRVVSGIAEEVWRLLKK